MNEGPILDTAVRPEQVELRIRALARDGWTFAGISTVMMLCAIVGMVLANEFIAHFDEIATFAGVGLACGVVCGLLSTFRLYQAGVIARIARWLVRLLFGMRLYFLLGIISAAIFCLFTDATVRASALAMTPALMFGGGVLAVTQWWRGVRLKPRKHALLRVLLAAPVFYLLACGAEYYVALCGAALSGYQLQINAEPQEYARCMRFCRTLPDSLRRLVWQHQPSPGRASMLSLFGFRPAADLRADAVGGNPGSVCSAWGWYVVAPAEALAFGLSVPETPTQTIPKPHADFNAGMVVGYAGSVEQIRARFEGHYSASFMSGLLFGVEHSKREPYFAAELKALVLSGSNLRTLWPVVMRADWEFTYQTIRAMAASGDKESLAKLSLAVPTITDVELAMAVVDSPHPGVRVLMLPLQFNFDPRWVGTLIRIAEGKMPNAEPFEQRTAALTLALFTIQRTQSFNYGTKPGIAPLSAQEEADIQQIVNEAHRRIGTKRTKP